MTLAEFYALPLGPRVPLVHTRVRRQISGRVGTVVSVVDGFDQYGSVRECRVFFDDAPNYSDGERMGEYVDYCFLEIIDEQAEKPSEVG